MAKITKEAALLYHSQGRPGKIEVVPTKPYQYTDRLVAGLLARCSRAMSGNPEKNPQDRLRLYR